jgi:hypothetical protein
VAGACLRSLQRGPRGNHRIGPCSFALPLDGAVGQYLAGELRADMRGDNTKALPVFIVLPPPTR